MKKKIILVDDMYEWLVDSVRMACEAVGFCELIKTGNAKTQADALKMIKSHPEVDFILLDGTFESGNCLYVVHYLSEDERKKIICYSGEPDEWMERLAYYGMHHFSAKNVDLPGCILGTCSCKDKIKPSHFYAMALKFVKIGK